jgi:putative phage-type endonuclease
MQQGSSEWHEWRRQGIGASYVPVVMGESDFATPLQLWEQMVGLAPATETNWAMQKGIDTEPKIRAMYELSYNVEVPAALAVHPDKPHFRASLDGFNQDAGLVVEFKCVGKEKHGMAKAGKVPETYYGQVQAQLFVTGAKVAHYVSYCEDDLAVVAVEPDPEYVSKMVPAVEKFWEQVVTKTPPKETDRDYVNLRSLEDKATFEAMASAKKVLDAAQEAYDEAKKKAIAAMGKHKRVVCGDIKIASVVAKGSVDYAKIPEVAALPKEYVESFRKDPVVRVTPVFPKG